MSNNIFQFQATLIDDIGAIAIICNSLGDTLGMCVMGVCQSCQFANNAALVATYVEQECSGSRNSHAP